MVHRVEQPRSHRGVERHADLPLTDCHLWTNQSGKSACDTTTNWTAWTGKVVKLSPADGFIKAMKNVKVVGLAFGSSGSYASGVALDGGTGTLTLSTLTITP